MGTSHVQSVVRSTGEDLDLRLVLRSRAPRDPAEPVTLDPTPQSQLDAVALRWVVPQASATPGALSLLCSHFSCWISIPSICLFFLWFLLLSHTGNTSFSCSDIANANVIILNSWPIYSNNPNSDDNVVHFRVGGAHSSIMNSKKKNPSLSKPCL